MLLIFVSMRRSSAVFPAIAQLVQPCSYTELYLRCSVAEPLFGLSGVGSTAAVVCVSELFDLMLMISLLRLGLVDCVSCMDASLAYCRW